MRLINRLAVEKNKTDTVIPLILCFKLLGISLGKVNNAPRATVNPISKYPNFDNNKTGIIAESVAFSALVKLVPTVNSLINLSMLF